MRYDCEHLSHRDGLNFCGVAAKWTEGIPVPVTEAACKVCLGCSRPKEFNRVTVSLGQSRLRTENHELYQSREPESLEYLHEGVKMSEGVRRYIDSTVEWVKEGRPERTDAEVGAILKICHACEEFQNGSCKMCGCTVNDSTGWTNKARRTTEHCPKGHW